MAKQSSPTQKMLFWWGLILFAWAAYRFEFKMSMGIYFDEFIAKPVVFILPIIYFIKRIEKKDFFEEISIKVKTFNEDIILGLGVGIAIFAILLFSVKMPVLQANFNKIVSTQNILLVILTAFATSISEEILSRGFVLKRLYDESKNTITSSFFASVLYFFLQVPILFSNDKIVGSSLLGVMVADVLFSLAISYVFLTRKSLILPILIHAFYILSLYLYLGFS